MAAILLTSVLGACSAPIAKLTNPGSKRCQETLRDAFEKIGRAVEEKVKQRWRGRTPTNKLVFVESDQDLRGQLLPVTVTWTGPWSMQARL